MNTRISHTGIVERVEPGHAVVRIVQAAACAACKAARACTAADAREKLVDVYDTALPPTLAVGQEVVVVADDGVATRSLLLGFGLPFAILVGVLALVLVLTGDEAVAGLSALAALVPYYALLWLLRHRIAQRIAFHLEA